MARGVPSVGGAVSSSSEDPIVFVVDDDPDMRDALNGLFAQVGLRVEACVSTIDFLGRQLPEAPSCIVVDIRMPRLSGFDLQAELARKGVSIPIIFITSHGDIPMSVQADEGWCNRFSDQTISRPGDTGCGQQSYRAPLTDRRVPAASVIRLAESSAEKECDNFSSF
jgi:CheY-like chemotaxis protein